MANACAILLQNYPRITILMLYRHRLAGHDTRLDLNNNCWPHNRKYGHNQILQMSTDSLNSTVCKMGFLK